MKKLLTISALLFAFNSFSQSASKAQTCESFGFSSDKSKCYTILKGQYLQAPVAKVCTSEINFTSDKLICLRSVINQTYHEEDLKICSKASFDSDVIRCLENTGNPLGATCDESLSEIRDLAKQAKASLRKGEIFKAIELITEILLITE